MSVKEYISHFKIEPHPEYCNLRIYPMVAELEKIAGLLSEFAEAYLQENKKCSFVCDENDEHSLFIKDNLLNYYGNDVIIEYSRYEVKEMNADVLLAPESKLLDVMKIKFENLFLYFTLEAYIIFKKYFWYYMNPNREFIYNNLICYTMIIKNGGPLLEQVLTENLPFFDRWCILDTGSTDGTQEVIKRVLKNKKGKLFEEPFVNFKVSRNRCLELAGKCCKFILMLDDTYALRGNLRQFLETVRGDQFSDSFSLMIQSDDNEYYSNRIIKSESELRYIHTIHEVITDINNTNVTIPIHEAYIFDYRSEYMEKRTNDRKKHDLELLFKELDDDPDDPRALYYIAQTYGCMGDEINKAKYFELRINHPVQGYIQEKIDALFELARSYNFKVNTHTKELLNEPLSESQWKRCEELYLQAYKLDISRPDSLYFIGIHYYIEGNYSLAYTYFKTGFEIGYPIHSQYSLKPTLSFHFLPKFLTEVCYYQNDSETGLKAAELFLTSSKYNTPQSNSWDLMMNWYKIHTNLLKMGNIAKIPENKGKIICIVTDGGWEPWSGKDILKGLGGSETWVIETARHINVSGYNVCVFCNTKSSEFFEGVGYNPIELFHTFIANTIVEHVIVSRFSEYIPVALKGHAKNVSFIFHDTLSPEMVIPNDPKLKNIFGLTEWHSNLIKNSFPSLVSKIEYSNYGIDQSHFHTIKVKNSFIYSSFPNRGLLILLKMWPQIISSFPDATLNIYCNLEHDTPAGVWVNKVEPEMMNEIKTLLKVMKRGITVHGWVNKETLSAAWKSSEYWLYPCIFEETFCLTAMEAAISKTFIITNHLAALAETVGDRGLIVHGNPREHQWQDQVITALKSLDDSSKETLLELNYQWAKERSWKSQTEKFLKKLIPFEKHWWKIKEIDDYLKNYTKDLKNIVDIGSGTCPFEGATVCIDNNTQATYNVDIQTEPLPHEFYDFVYSRHLIEDLAKPHLVLEQIKLKSKAGYIETPSPYAECCYGIDYDTDYTKMGYHHHHSILWVEQDTLYILPKVFEFMKEIDQTPIREKLLDPFSWNTYYMYTDFKYELIPLPKTKEDYLAILYRSFFMATVNVTFIKNVIKKM